MTKTLILAALALLVPLASAASAQEQSLPSSPQCPIDTTKDADTGRPRNGVSVCYDNDNHSASVGVSTNGKEIEHFFKYPVGQSDKSVAKQIGNAVHNFFHHL